MKSPILLFLLPVATLARQHPMLVPQTRHPPFNELLNTKPDLSLLNLLFQQNSSVLEHLTSNLAEEEQVTFLAPSDDAFRKLLEGHHARNGDQDRPLMNDTLALYTSLLSYHTIRGRYNSDEMFLPSPKVMETYLQNTHSVAGGRGILRTERMHGVGWIFGGVGEGTFLRDGDVPLRNGLMHIIDSFLRLPMPVSETAAELGGSDFVSALHDAGIKAQIDATPGTTVFVPRQMDIPEDMTPMDLIELLTYHVVDSALLFSEKLGTTVTQIVTAGGEKLDVTVRDGEIYIDDSKIVKADIITKTGVIYILDRMLDPHGPPYTDPSGRTCRCLNKNCANNKRMCDREDDKDKKNKGRREAVVTSNLGAFLVVSMSWFAVWAW